VRGVSVYGAKAKNLRGKHESRKGISGMSNVELRPVKEPLRIDLGLAIAATHVTRGVGLTQREIAAYCGCSQQRIFQIEQRALRKLRNRLRFVKDPTLRELMETLSTK
jgi:hypothetical protein